MKDPSWTGDEALEAGRKLGGSLWVVKAQIHAGGRGKAGGVKLAKAADEAESLAKAMLGMTLKTHQTGPEGQKVRRLLIEEGADIKHEYYVAALTDRATQSVAMMASSEGGMDLSLMLGVDWSLNPVNIDPPRHTGYRKVLTPNDFPSLAAVAERLQEFERYYEQIARPFEWKFTREDLDCLLAKLQPPPAVVLAA